MRAFKNAWFERFARKQGIADKALLEAIERAERGLSEAHLTELIDKGQFTGVHDHGEELPE